MRYAMLLGLGFIGFSIQADCNLKRCDDVEINRVFVEASDLKISLASDSSICSGIYLVLSQYEQENRADRVVKIKLELAAEKGDLVSFKKLDCATGIIKYQVLAR